MQPTVGAGSLYSLRSQTSNSQWELAEAYWQCNEVEALVVVGNAIATPKGKSKSWLDPTHSHANVTRDSNGLLAVVDKGTGRFDDHSSPAVLCCS